MLRGIRNSIHELGSRGERDVDRSGSRLDALLMPSDCNFVEELAVIEGDISHDEGTTTLAFTLTLGRELAGYVRTTRIQSVNIHTIVRYEKFPPASLHDTKKKNEGEMLGNVNSQLEDKKTYPATIRVVFHGKEGCKHMIDEIKNNAKSMITVIWSEDHMITPLAPVHSSVSLIYY